MSKQYPFSLKLYARSLSLFSFRLTGRFLVIFTVVIGAILSILIYTSTEWITAGIVFISMSLSAPLRLIFISKDDWNRDIEVRAMNFIPFFAIIVLFGLVSGGAYMLFQELPINPSLASVPFTVGLSYWGLLYFSGQKYKREVPYYVQKFSPHKDSWRKAGLYLDNGLNLLEQGNNYRAFYNFYQSGKYYTALSEDEEYQTEKDIANLYQKAIAELKSVPASNPEERQLFMSNAESIFNEISSRTSWRICDTCKTRTKTQYMHHVVSNGETEGFYCEDCYKNPGNSKQKETEQQEEQQTKSSKTQSSKKTNRSETKQRRKQKYQSYNARGISKKKARKILGVDKDATDEEIKKVYRKKAKTAHPDKGGDEDKFSRLSKARDRLID